MMPSFLIINGPNLNMLGKREPEIYGAQTLDEIAQYTEEKIGTAAKIEWYQSNIEGEIVGRLQLAASQNYRAVVINPGAYAHTSVAIHDAIKILKIPVIEVHLSNVYRRESFRETLLTAKACLAIMTGLGKDAYWLAVKSQI
ncbi:MAG: 3-dehydroquinate dehydratase [Bacteriovoracaceae bacterium]|nr:3-dehydroquinate dehydratase [Bacteriovoracaceae bacterium]